MIQSSAEFVAFLDHDDLWHPTKLQRQVEAMEKSPDIALCYTNYEVIDHEGVVLLIRDPVSAAQSVHHDLTVFAAGSESFLAIAELSVPSCTAAMVRRSALAVSGLFDPLLSSCEDHDLWFRLCTHHKSAYLRSVEAGYRRHAGQRTRTVPSTNNDEQVWNKYERLARETRNPALATASRRMRKLARRNAAAVAYDQARLNVRTRKWVGAMHYFRKSAYLDPHATFYNSSVWALNKIRPMSKLDSRTKMSPQPFDR